jgi:uncharacterized membrane protein YbhN (UPF0104 family)
MFLGRPGCTIVDMRGRFQAWLPVLRAILILVVLAGVGWYFWKLLSGTSPGDDRSGAEVLAEAVRGARLEGLVASGLLSLAGLGCWGAFWMYLMRQAGEPLPLLTAARVYYLSHLGKYGPTKGVALLMRTDLAAQAGASASTAALTATYETLTSMAAGALLAFVVLWVAGVGNAWLWWLNLGLLALAGGLIAPGVFDRLIARTAARFGARGPLPDFGPRTLLIGLFLTACGWGLLGFSLAVLLEALKQTPTALDAGLWLRCTAAASGSWVAGFFSSIPGGLGARELVLQASLGSTLHSRDAAVVSLVLRFVWTVAELLTAAVLYPLRSAERGMRTQPAGATPATPTEGSNPSLEPPPSPLPKQP